jgi:hypothetical protein
MRTHRTAQVERQISQQLKRQTALREERAALQERIKLEHRAPRKDWTSASFPWDTEVERLLRDVFKIPTFRQGCTAQQQRRSS